MSKIMSTLYKSLVRSIGDLIEEAKTTTGDAGIEYWSWESRADENDMPTQTLMGLSDYTFRENLGLWEVRCGIVISTYNDRNLHQESEILDIVHTMFGEHKTVDLYDELGNVFSQLAVTDFEIMPMGQSELRNYRTVGLELKRVDTSTPQ